MRLGLVLLLAFYLLSGCATHEKFIKRYNGWIGQPVTSFIAAEGYPDRSIKLPNGHTVYVYEHSRIYSVPTLGPMVFGYYDRFGVFGYGSEVVQESCKLFIETNKKGKIIRWGSRGNACRSR